MTAVAGLRSVAREWNVSLLTNGAAYSFALDLPSGDYYVTIYSGDAIASNRTTVEAEAISLGTISTAVGAFGPLTRVLSVTDGQVVFEGAALSTRLAGYEGTVELTVSGHLVDGRAFTGTDVMRLF